MRKLLAIVVCVLCLSVAAQDKKPDPPKDCAALRLENAQLKLQLATLREQMLQTSYQLNQQDKAKAEEEVNRLQAEQTPKTAQSIPPKQ